jgi:NAD-dependent SIR2 family protein deacetylase
MARLFCGDAYTWGGPSGRRCTRCGNVVPEGHVPAVRIDGSLELHCPGCESAIVRERNAFLQSRISAKRSA